MRTSYMVIKGKGDFPIDMLRYDDCFPATESDSYAIAKTFDSYGEWEICVKKQVRTYSKVRDWTNGRWASFGCSMESIQHPSRRRDSTAH